MDGQEAVGSGTLQSFFVKSLTASLASDLTVIVLVTSPLAAEADNASSVGFPDCNAGSFLEETS